MVKPKELVEKLVKFSNKYDDGAELAAKSAFLANLTEILKIELPDRFLFGGEKNMKCHFYFYVGCIVGYKDDIKEEDIRQAHLSMIFVWSRAIISEALGHEKVNNLGVPPIYGIV